MPTSCFSLFNGCEQDGSPELPESEQKRQKRDKTDVILTAHHWIEAVVNPRNVQGAGDCSEDGGTEDAAPVWVKRCG
ncbi:hypothetical protein SB758_36345, partial [Burkholderia sp. SIMBA_013]